MNINPLSQRAPAWRYKKLGFSNLTIGGYGCTITALTCLLNYVEGKNYTPSQVNDRLKVVRAFQGALLIWSRVPLAFPSLKWVKRAYSYSNVDVAWNIYVKKMPVMVEVNGAKIGAPRHWLLFLGNQRAIDPWTGQIISTSYYPATGYAVFGRK